MKIVKGIVSGVFGLIILSFSLSVACGGIAPMVNGIGLTDLMIATAIGTMFGAGLLYLSFLIVKGRSNARLENGSATIGLGLLLLFLWPYRQFHYWKTGNSDFTFSSLVWGSLVTIVIALTGILLVYKQKRQET